MQDILLWLKSPNMNFVAFKVSQFPKEWHLQQYNTEKTLSLMIRTIGVFKYSKLKRLQISWIDQQPPLLVFCVVAWKYLSLRVTEGFCSPIKTLFCVKSSKLTQGMTTGNKSFIMLDRWNKPSHDSSNSTIGIFTHTKDICNPLQCKHMIQRHFWMLENKPIYPPKMKHNKPAFSAAKYLRVQLKVHWLNIFKNKFPQVNETESLPHTHTHTTEELWAWQWMWK